MKSDRIPIILESAEGLLRPEFNISGLTSGIVLIVGGLGCGKKRLARGIAKRSGYIHAGELRQPFDWDRIVSEMGDVPVVATYHAPDIPSALERIHRDLSENDQDLTIMGRIRSIVCVPPPHKPKVLSVLPNPWKT